MSDYEENPMYCKHLKGFDEDGDCKDCALESIYCAEQLSMRNIRLEAKVAELGKENKEIKTNMVYLVDQIQEGYDMAVGATFGKFTYWAKNVVREIKKAKLICRMKEKKSDGT